MSLEEISERFSFINLNRKDSSLRDRSSVINPDSPYGETCIGEIDWFIIVVKGGYYIPAKIGMQFIKAAKNPVISFLMKRLP